MNMILGQQPSGRPRFEAAVRMSSAGQKASTCVAKSRKITADCLKTGAALGSAHIKLSDPHAPTA